MTDNLPDYTAVEPPEDKPPGEYTHHERRAELLQLMERAGGPHAINLARLAGRYDVHRSTLSRDRQRLKEAIGERLGDDAKLEKRTLYRRVVRELLEEDDWRATKAAWDVRDDYDSWLADLGEQYREPDRAQVDVRSRHSEVTYEIVRGGDDDPLPTTASDDGVDTDDDDGEVVDYEQLGFTSTPTVIDVDEGGRDE